MNLAPLADPKFAAVRTLEVSARIDQRRPSDVNAFSPTDNLRSARDPRRETHAAETQLPHQRAGQGWSFVHDLSDATHVMPPTAVPR
jgi:hypothetical protein